MEIRLGDMVRDTVTGLTGIAVCRSQWMTGCWRILIQPQDIKDGKPVDSTSVDETLLKLVKAGVIKCENSTQQTAIKGGPMPPPSQRPAPTR